jgi:hypothetical protein
MTCSSTPRNAGKNSARSVRNNIPLVAKTGLMLFSHTYLQRSAGSDNMLHIQRTATSRRSYRFCQFFRPSLFWNRFLNSEVFGQALLCFAHGGPNDDPNVAKFRMGATDPESPVRNVLHQRCALNFYATPTNRGCNGSGEPVTLAPRRVRQN